MERVRIQIFNTPITNGNVYIAENKETVERIFGKFLKEEPKLFLTNENQDIDLKKRDNEDFDEFDRRYKTIELESIAGKFENIEIIVTDEIGIDDLPIIEVWADLKILDNDRGKYVESMFETNVATFGMRSIAKCYPGNKRLLMHIISYDLVSKKA